MIYKTEKSNVDIKTSKDIKKNFINKIKFFCRRILIKLRNQPENVRKIIFWVVLIVISLGLGTWWVNSAYRKIKEFKKEEFFENLDFSPLKEKIQEIPKLEIPTFDEKELKEMEEFGEEIEKEIEKNPKNE